MAGIGFELRRVLKKDSLLSMAKVYGYSAVLSSGPWVISIIAIIMVGFVNITSMGTYGNAVSYQIVITYSIALASSMIVTGFIQLPFTRYIADRIYEDKEDEVLPAYYGVLLVIWAVSFVLVLPMLYFIFPNQSNYFIITSMSTFLVLSGVWISNIIAASLKYYHAVIAAYAVSYGLIILLSYYFGNTIERLITIFFLGNTLLLSIMMILITKSYESTRLISLKFFDRHLYWKLGIAGLLYNMGAWVDKFIFWYHPLTGYEVIGKLNASVVYDLPIFIAYLSILPGMAIFFFRLEADFAEKYDLFFDAVRSEATLHTIRRYRNEMAEVVRHSIKEILLIQGIMNIILFMVAEDLFAMLHIPQLYLGLFYVLTIGAQLQLGFMSVMAFLYYLDRQNEAMWLAVLFFILNGVLTFISIDLGPSMFGYGYAISLLITFILSLVIVRRKLRELDYETFMLQ